MKLESKTEGAWLLHHTLKLEKFDSTYGLDTIYLAGKSGKLLSTITASDETSKISQEKLRVFADSCRINNMELKGILPVLKDHHLIDIDSKGNIEALGVTQASILNHVSTIYNDSGPSNIENASLRLSELISEKPIEERILQEQINDEFRLSAENSKLLFSTVNDYNIVDSEVLESEKLYFNGNLFKKGTIKKVNAILQTVSPEEQIRVVELNEKIDSMGCIEISAAHRIIGENLFNRLTAIGVYEVNTISNDKENKYLITKSITFEKYGNSMIDDALDLAKAMVSSLSYGMLYSDSYRGRINSFEALINKLLRGESVGSAPAIGQDYKALEMKRVVEIIPDTKGNPPTHFFMRLLKKDVGLLAKEVLLNGNASETILFNSLNSKAYNYTSPEKNRELIRQKSNKVEDGRAIQAKLNAIRTMK